MPITKGMATIPPSTLEGLIRYRDKGIPVGSFLRAVLENNLREAICSADDYNQPALVAIIKWCLFNMPSGAWGSPEKVQAWLEEVHT